MSQGRPRPAQKKSLPPKVVKEPPRLLEKNPGMAKRDYTDRLDRAMSDEPEAIDAETASRFAAENNARHAALHAEDERRREVRSLTAQLREVGNLALQRGVDLPELHRIRVEVESARKRLAA